MDIKKLFELAGVDKSPKVVALREAIEQNVEAKVNNLKQRFQDLVAKVNVAHAKQFTDEFNKALEQHQSGQDGFINGEPAGILLMKCIIQELEMDLGLI